jgi:chitin disaccharide deacetylase
VRALVVNADDLGLSAGVNEGVLRAHARGIVTSTSLMVRQPAAAVAAAAVRQQPRLSVGLHVDLAEWRSDGEEWSLRYAWTDVSDAAAVRREVSAQLALFQRLVGRPPSHLDSHHRVHREQPAAAVLAELAARLEVPLRHAPPVRYCGSFYGQGRRNHSCPEAIQPQALAGLIHDLPDGITELCCHPAVQAEPGWQYGAERVVELGTLCSAAVRAAVRQSGVRLLGFRDLRGQLAA